MNRVQTFLAGLSFCTMALSFGGCRYSVEVPNNATLVYHGPAMDMMSGMPPGPGTIYVLDGKSGRVVRAGLVPGPGELETGKTIGMSDLPPGKTYTVYFVKSPGRPTTRP